jgi:hypothetical protein
MSRRAARRRDADAAAEYFARMLLTPFSPSRHAAIAATPFSFSLIFFCYDVFFTIHFHDD